MRKLTRAQLTTAANDENKSVSDYYREKSKAKTPRTKARLQAQERESLATLAKRRRGIRTSD